MIPMPVADAEVQNDSSTKKCMGQSEMLRKVLPVAAFVVIITIYMLGSRVYTTTESDTAITTLGKVNTNQKQVRAMTWNIAAINNNPFEYWITNKDPSYNRIMSNVSTFIDYPGALDVTVETIFTETMYNQLEESMVAANWTGIAETRALWNSDYKKRKIISQFIKDTELGKKRLVSMPDRVTNTINTATEGVVMRPTVVNCYNKGDLGSLDLWWEQWREFIFKKQVVVKKAGVNTVVKVKDMFSKIKKSKYPSITAAEEAISIPLQTLCAAVFDAILVNMMNIIDGTTWQPLREDMCNKLNRKKTERITQILQTAYSGADIHFLQEVASSFAEYIGNKPLANLFDIYYPAAMDTDRDQNSFILLKKGKYKDVTEVTNAVLKKLDTSSPVPVANGDLLVLTALDIRDNSRYIFASFHGDTNGLATIPIVTAVHDYAMSKPNYKLLFGLDANTYSKPEIDQQGMVQFAEFYTSKNINSCYGQHPNPLNFTTFHARTHLQPQLNKAVRYDEKDKKGDKNPKDFILFFENDFHVVSTEKDNTGEHKYIENMVFPTLSFPSDHGITSTILIEKVEKSNRTKMENDREDKNKSKKQKHDKELNEKEEKQTKKNKKYNHNNSTGVLDSSGTVDASTPIKQPPATATTATTATTTTTTAGTASVSAPVVTQITVPVVPAPLIAAPVATQLRAPAAAIPTPVATIPVPLSVPIVPQSTTPAVPVAPAAPGTRYAPVPVAAPPATQIGVPVTVHAAVPVAVPGATTGATAGAAPADPTVITPAMTAAQLAAIMKNQLGPK